MDVKELLFEAVKQTLTNTNGVSDALEQLTAQEAGALYQFSKAHDLAHYVGRVWTKPCGNDEQTEAVRQKLAAAYNTALMRYVRITYELEQITACMEAESIPHIPLKGSVLRTWYPDPSMRTSCDIDLLVHEKDLDKARSALVEKMNFRFEGKSSHDMSFFSPEGVHLELHYSLLESNVVGTAEKPLQKVWEYATPVEEGKFQCRVSDEFFYYYHIAHMAKHFVHGGCGIRPFIDIYVLGHCVEHDSRKREDLLREGGLFEFAKQAEKLSGIWFGEGEHDELTRKMETYILFGGVYGNMENRVTVGQARKGGKLKYILSRIWLPFDVLKFHYPSLEKHRRLLFFYEVRRWGKLIFCGGLKRSTTELRINSDVSAEKKENVQGLLESLQLDR